MDIGLDVYPPADLEKWTCVCMTLDEWRCPMPVPSTFFRRSAAARGFVGGAAVAVAIAGLSLFFVTTGQADLRGRFARQLIDQRINDNAQQMVDTGRSIFRHDTFGSEDFWGGSLRLHQAIAGSANGGVGSGLSPTAALGLGLKVDATVLPAALIQQIRRGEVDLDDPATTLALLQL
ncbi:MAG TPA: hypothetical protein VM779_05140, partial [Thermoanaerobaculia bacterium]|nr:hypothetical protein [Thermoanaerobaculia bacterium]